MFYVYSIHPRHISMTGKALLPAYSFFPIHDVQEPLKSFQPTGQKRPEKKEVFLDFLLLASRLKFYLVMTLYNP